MGVDWRGYEADIARAFAGLGYRVSVRYRAVSRSNVEYEVDVLATDPLGLVRIGVQCKCFSDRKVSRDMVSEWLGVCEDLGLRPAYASCTGYTEDALKLAKSRGFILIDGYTLWAPPYMAPVSLREYVGGGGVRAVEDIVRLLEYKLVRNLNPPEYYLYLYPSRDPSSGAELRHEGGGKHRLILPGGAEVEFNLNTVINRINRIISSLDKLKDKVFISSPWEDYIMIVIKDVERVEEIVDEIIAIVREAFKSYISVEPLKEMAERLRKADLRPADRDYDHI